MEPLTVEQQQELIDAYRRVRAKNESLKLGIRQEMDRARELDDSNRSLASRLREAQESVDRLEFHNSRLTKRLVAMSTAPSVSDLDPVLSHQRKKSAGVSSASSSPGAGEATTAAAVMRAELQGKIEENARLHLRVEEQREEHGRLLDMMEKKLATAKQAAAAREEQMSGELRAAEERAREAGEQRDQIREALRSASVEAREAEAAAVGREHELVQRVAGLERELDELRRRGTGPVEMLEQMSARVRSLEGEKKLLVTERDALDAKLAAALSPPAVVGVFPFTPDTAAATATTPRQGASEDGAWAVAVKALEVSNEDKKREDVLRQQYDSVLGQNNALLQQADRRCSELRRELEVARDQTDKNVQALAASQDVARKLAGELQLVKEDLQSTRDGYDSQLQILTEHIASLNGSVTTLDDQLTSVKSCKVRCGQCRSWNTVAYLVSNGQDGRLCSAGAHNTGTFSRT